MEAVVLRREELYAAVWERALAQVAAAYDISGVALRKICKKLSVPVPPRGYWARLAAGHKAKVPPLPKLKPGGATEHQLVRARVSSRAFQVEDSAAQKIVVPEVLEKPHRLVRSSSAALRRAAKTMSRAASEEACLDIVASPQCLDRALRIMDTLLKALEERGYAVEVTTPLPSPHYGYSPSPSVTRAFVGGEWVSFSLAERREQVQDSTVPRPPLYGREIVVKGSGHLTLRITSPSWSSGLRQSWSDGQKQRVEDCLGSFVVGITAMSAALSKERAERERQEKEWAEARKRQEERQRRDEIEQLLRYDLSSRSADWNEALHLEEFLNAFEESAASSLDPNGNALIASQWFAWAKSYVRKLQSEALKLDGVRIPQPDSKLQAWNARRAQVTPEDIVAYLSTYSGDSSGGLE